MPHVCSVIGNHVLTVRQIIAYCQKHPVWVVVGCACISYSTSFFGIFHFDDFGTVVNYGPSFTFTAWWHSIATGRRALLKLSYVINWKSGAGLAGFHAVNLAIHCAAAAIVFHLAKLAQNSRFMAPSGLGAPFFAAVLFAVHPIHSESVTYISGRSSSLMAFFYCAGLLCYVHGARTDRRIFLWLWSPALFISACFVKEAALTFPMALLIWEWCFEHFSWKTVFRRQWVHWTISCVLLLGAFLHPAYFRLLEGSAGMSPFYKAVHMNVQGFLLLLLKLLMVNRLSIDPNPLSPSCTNACSLLEIGALIGLCIAALAYAKKWPRVGFAIGWMALQIFMVYSVFPRTDVLNERHVYLPDAGLCICLGAVLSKCYDYAGPTRLRVWVAAIFIGLLMVFTNLRGLDYRSSIALWNSTVRVSPFNSRAWNNLGLAYERQHLFDKSKDAYKQAVAVDGINGVARKNLQRVELRIEYSTP